MRLLASLVRTDEVVLPAADRSEDRGRPQLAGAGELEVTEHLLHQAALVVRVVDGETRIEPDRRAVATEHARRERVERAHRDVSPALPDEREDPLAHLVGGLVGEGDGKDVPRPHATDADEVRDPVGEHARLAAARSGEDQQRPVRGGDGACLLRVEARDDLSGELIRAAAAGFSGRGSLAAESGPAVAARCPNQAASSASLGCSPARAPTDPRPNAGDRLGAGGLRAGPPTPGPAHPAPRMRPNRPASRSHPGTGLTPSNSTGERSSRPYPGVRTLLLRAGPGPFPGVRADCGRASVSAKRWPRNNKARIGFLAGLACRVGES